MNPGRMMAVAQAIATDETVELPTQSQVITLPVVSTDPVDDLVDRVRGLAGRVVDALQVAASLESEGVTDRAAMVEYGYRDVFALADEVFRRLGPALAAPAPARRPAGSGWQLAARDISHGLLYLMPGAVFPAMLAVLDRRSLVLGLVLGGGLGWVWAGGTSWLAYQLLGRGHGGRAGRVLRFSAVAGLPAAALLGAGVQATAGGGYRLVALAVGQMAYQMASTILMFYRHEGWLVVTMAPAVVAGGMYLILGESALGCAIAFGVSCVAATLAVALYRTCRTGGVAGQPPVRQALRGEMGGLGWNLAYTALSAAFLLQAQAPYVLGRLEITLGAVPLFVGMGLVEWRARWFVERSRALLAEVHHPREFVTRVWLLLAAGVASCVGTVGVLAAALLATLRQVGLLSPAAMAMTAAHTTLAGAYFLSFILAGQARYGWLCAALVISSAGHGAVALLASPPLSPTADTALFAGSAVLLLVLFVAALAPTVAQVRRYR